MKTINVPINLLSTRKAYVSPQAEVFSLPETEYVLPIMASEEQQHGGGAGNQGHSDGTIEANKGWFDTDESGFDAKWND